PIPQRGRHALPGAKVLERERRASQISGDPEPIAFPRPGATHRSIRDADDTHVHQVAIGAGQIAPQYLCVDVLHHARDTRHDLRGWVGALVAVDRRNPERGQHAERFGALRGQIGERRAGGAKSDLLEVEPVGPEVDVLERGVNADGQGRGAERNQRAVVPEFRHVARDLGDLREDPTNAVEFLAWAEVHRIAMYYNT